MTVIESNVKLKNTIGSIGFKALRIFCIIGVEANERILEQEIYVDLEVKYDISSCVTHDLVEYAIDYVQLTRICKQIAQEGKFQLIETYAHTLQTYLHDQYPICYSKIRVEKPSAIFDASYSFTELERKS